MKLAGVFLVLPIIMTVAACKKSVPIRKGAVPLSGCNTQIFGNDGVKICYDSLVHESRCPADGICFWQGAAVGKFSFFIKTDKHTLTLSTLRFGPYSRDTIVGNYKIELLNIDPYPGEHAPPPASASVKITKL